MRFFRLCVPAWLVVCVFVAVASAQDDAKVRLGQIVTRATEAEKQGRQQAALDAYAQAVQLSKEIFGPNHIYVAAMSQAQGNVLRQMGQPERAVPLIEVALKIAETNNDK